MLSFVTVKLEPAYTPERASPPTFAGVEVSTGPLGQGISNGVGLAMAQAHLGATFNREGFSVIDNYTFVICGDGEAAIMSKTHRHTYRYYIYTARASLSSTTIPSSSAVMVRR